MTKELEKDVFLILWDFRDYENLKKELKTLPNNSLAMITKEEHKIEKVPSITNLFGQTEADVLFAASPYFHFDHKDLSYYYWKYYPRKETPLNYVDHEYFLGKVSSLQLMVDDLQHYIASKTSLSDAFHRLFVDSNSGFLKTQYLLQLDHEGQLFNHHKKALPSSHWFLNNIQLHLFLQYRRQEKSNLFSAYVKSLRKTLAVLIHNGGETRFHKLFRYAPNVGTEVKKSIDTLLNALENNIPFCFSHFNDGELTFIKKYQNADHKEVWFGRCQNQYTEKLGKLLVEAFLLRKDNYFVGIPCGQSHPRLRKVATDLRPPDTYTIAAMTLHHNSAKYPKILGMLREKKPYYITNPYQDLAFFRALGLEVTEENRINVPFKNSHKEYDKLKDLRFQENSVVLMMCGMLGKVLTPIWFEQNPTCTFLTFGSSFDDMIQKNINFRLVPKEAPFARHLFGTRSFLFGAKKSTSDCFDLKNPADLE